MALQVKTFATRLDDLNSTSVTQIGEGVTQLSHFVLWLPQVHSGTHAPPHIQAQIRNLKTICPQEIISHSTWTDYLEKFPVYF